MCVNVRAGLGQQFQGFGMVSRRIVSVGYSWLLGWTLLSGSAVAATDCAELRNLHRQGTEITTAVVVPAGTFTAPEHPDWWPAETFSHLPAFCRVAGRLHPTPDSDIRFEVWLPASGWNGKFLQAGNGGAAGSLIYPVLAAPLARRYAVAHTDTGHVGGGGDFSWAAGHPEKVTDFAYRAVHEVTLAGKALVQAYYGDRPRLSYWMGCSTGGRQGYVEAQRFPDDYDGIIAGAPVANWVPEGSLAVILQRELTSPTGFPPAKLPLLHQAAVAACDLNDGVKDGVIANPDHCRFDPGTLLCKSNKTEGCLTRDEIASARRMYAGVVDGKGRQVYPGTGPGSELHWDSFASPGFLIGESAYRYLVYRNPKWSAQSFDVDHDQAAAEAADHGSMSAMDPNLSPFLGHGGKLLTYHGTADSLSPYRNTRAYHWSVERTVGYRAAKGVRYYEVPGMDHCAGGAGAGDIDWLHALDSWVETGRAPGALPAKHAADQDGPAFERPVCAYPEQARLQKGRGKHHKAEYWACAAPK